MNTTRKVFEWLICASIVNLMLGCFLFKKLKNINKFCCCQIKWICDIPKRKKTNFFFKGDENRVMIKNEIYCYISGLMKWNINKKTSYIVESKKFCGKIYILNLGNKTKSIFG